MNEEFHAYLRFLIEHVKKTGTRAGIRIAAWPTPKVLTRTDSRLVRFTAPEDSFIPIAYYRQLHGDPASNGKGHKARVLSILRLQ